MRTSNNYKITFLRNTTTKVTTTLVAADSESAAVKIVKKLYDIKKIIKVEKILS